MVEPNIQEMGIATDPSQPYQHEHSGHNERLHKSILRKIRRMLIALKLPIRFYIDAQLTAIYLHNRMVHANHSKTPFEIIFGYKPDLGHLRPLVIICCMHILALQRSKLDNSAVKCRMLGYSDSDNTFFCEN